MNEMKKMAVTEKLNTPPVYQMETISFSELADEFKINTTQLIRLFQREGFLENGVIPSQSMVMAGNMVESGFEEDDNVILPLITSEGYFFFVNYLKKYLQSRMLGCKQKQTQLKTKRKRVRIIIRKRKQNDD